MDDVESALSPEQEQHADAIFRRIETLYRQEARRVARLFAGKPTEQLLGKTEFELRDRLLALGAASVEAALDERKKGGTKGRA
jgi:hypothetical protein